jgi:hypothetical protein
MISVWLRRDGDNPSEIGGHCLTRNLVIDPQNQLLPIAFVKNNSPLSVLRNPPLVIHGHHATRVQNIGGNNDRENDSENQCKMTQLRTPPRLGE